MEIQSSSSEQIRRSLQRAAIETRYQTTRQLDRIVQGGRQDQVQISSSALDRSRLQASLVDKAMQLPEIREDKVALARERMASGFYNREGLVSEVGDRMLQDGVLQPAKDGGEDLPATSYRDELMKEVGEKMQNGFYTDDQVMAFVADRLVQIYGIDEA